MMICIVYVLRLRVGVTYMNYRANGEYALSLIKKYYPNVTEIVLNTTRNFCVIV